MKTMSQELLYSDADLAEFLSFVILESCPAEEMQELVETVGSFQRYAKEHSESKLKFFTPDIAPEHFMLRDVLFTIADAYGWELSQWAVVSGRSGHIYGYPMFARKENKL